MPGPNDLRARLEAVLSSQASPDKKDAARKMLDKLTAYESSRPGDAGGGIGGGGEFAPGTPSAVGAEDPLAARKQAIDLQAQAEADALHENLPTAYLPTESLTDEADSNWPNTKYTDPSKPPIFYDETQGSTGNAGWKEAMAQADAEGRPAYRTRDEFQGASGKALALLRMLQSGTLGLDRATSGGLITRAIHGEEGQKPFYESAVAYPGVASSASLAGAALPQSGTQMLGRGMARTFGMDPAKGVMQNLVRGGAAGAVTGAIQGGMMEAAAGGDNVPAAIGHGATVGAPLGALGGLLSVIGKSRADALRNPSTQAGNDLAAVERIGGETRALAGPGTRGVYPGPEFARLQEEAMAAGKDPTRGVQTPAATAAAEGAPVLGRSLQDKMDTTLGGIQAQRAALPYREAELSALAKSQVTAAKQAMRDGKMLPGHNARFIAGELRKSADVVTAARNSDTALAADPELTMSVGEARAIGLVKGPRLPEDANQVVIIRPRTADARELEAARAAYDKAGNVQAGTYKQAGDQAYAQKFAGALRENRAALGDEFVAQSAAESKALTEMKNTLEAAGLPRDLRSVDMADQGVKDALYGAMLRYRASAGSLPADEALDALASGNPRLRNALDLARGAAAAQRIQAAGGGMKVTGSPQSGAHVYGALDAFKFRADPLMRYLRDNAGVPAGFGVLAPRKQERQ